MIQPPGRSIAIVECGGVPMIKVLQKRGLHASLLGVVAALLLGAAPLASARHWGLGISISGPGFGIGYSGCHHCRGGYVGGGYVGAYVAPYYGGYYGPGWPVGYYDSYYPRYDYYPSYGVVYYDRSPRYHGRHHDGYRGHSYRGRDHGYGGHGYRNHGGHSGHHASYYDRGRRH
jgi:hypothetical protein